MEYRLFFVSCVSSLFLFVVRDCSLCFQLFRAFCHHSFRMQMLQGSFYFKFD
ncbi:unnamed protein product [Musa banksii]